ncbi:MAG TPA: class IV adenylate cyclase [Candidatus Mediterraneibacter gallistercoris]|uniref:Class IV adenylate cyclase n=1 Tax=Candidatus Mediterraneibacter gallistercoris TaxID=2838671 RepID=A0A9D2T1A0_9FIRM|nr:class IV adenylate cyclase [Candidatus Mediterraneibacter gallistercoris]
MIEVEVKLPVADLDGIRTELLKNGFKETAFIEERDTYFDNPQGDIRTNGEALRVREMKDHLTGKKRTQFNFKGKKLDTRTMTREELETGVEDGEICRNILQAIGYAPAAPEVVKDRTMLQKGKITACLDKVHGLGEFLELEILADSEEQKDIALGRIENILNDLGYQISDTVQTSYLSMLMLQNKKKEVLP